MTMVFTRAAFFLKKVRGGGCREHSFLFFPRAGDAMLFFESTVAHPFCFFVVVLELELRSHMCDHVTRKKMQ